MYSIIIIVPYFLCLSAVSPLQVNTASRSQSSSKEALLSPRTKVLTSFHNIQSKLQPLLQFSIDEFASKCFSRNLISMEVYDKLFNRSAQSTDLERAGYLILIIYKRAESLEACGKRSEAKELIRRFGETVYAVDNVLKRVGEEISE